MTNRKKSLLRRKLLKTKLLLKRKLLTTKLLLIRPLLRRKLLKRKKPLTRPPLRRKLPKRRKLLRRLLPRRKPPKTRKLLKKLRLKNPRKILSLKQPMIPHKSQSPQASLETTNSKIPLNSRAKTTTTKEIVRKKIRSPRSERVSILY